MRPASINCFQYSAVHLSRPWKGTFNLSFSRVLQWVPAPPLLFTGRCITGWDPVVALKKMAVTHILLVPTSGGGTRRSCWVLTHGFNKSGSRDRYWFVMRVMFSAEINRGSGEIWGQSVSQSLEPPQSAVVHILYWFGSHVAGAGHQSGEMILAFMMTYKHCWREGAMQGRRDK